MRTIWKYDVPLETLGEGNKTTIDVPKFSEVLYATSQYNSVVVYFVVETDSLPVCDKWDIWVFGMGHTVTSPPYATPLGVASLFDGSLMFHVFGMHESRRKENVAGNDA